MAEINTSVEAFTAYMHDVRTEGTADKWPVLLLPYVSDPKA